MHHAIVNAIEGFMARHSVGAPVPLSRVTVAERSRPKVCAKHSQTNKRSIIRQNGFSSQHKSGETKHKLMNLI
jgi:hypothetical protein